MLEMQVLPLRRPTPENRYCKSPLSKAEYMIFDEATSSVDPESEKGNLGYH